MNIFVFIIITSKGGSREEHGATCMECAGFFLSWLAESQGGQSKAKETEGTVIMSTHTNLATNLLAGAT